MRQRIKMEKHVTRWFNVEKVPSGYVIPQEYQPGKVPIPICDSVPVIDLMATDQFHIIKAAQEFGFFQVINHGISERLMSETTRVFKEYFDLPSDEKAKNSPDKSSSVYTSCTGSKDGISLWRENIKLPCHPLEECMQHWPKKPTAYREVVATYLIELRKLSLRIFELISKGLGLHPAYFNDISQVQLLTANSYPPCPDPSLTLGIPKHIDGSLVTVVHQGDVCGLQVLKDGQWIGVEALPNAFVVNIGSQLEIISNGKLRSPEHRAVTNSSEVRTSIATFVNPAPTCIVEPAKVLVNEVNPPRYEPALYKDFVFSSNAFGPHTQTILQHWH